MLPIQVTESVKNCSNTLINEIIITEFCLFINPLINIVRNSSEQ